MTKKKWVEFPKIWKSIKHSWRNFWYHAKYHKIDAGLCIFTFFAIIYCVVVDRYENLIGAAGVLLIYSYGVVIRLGNEVKEKQRLQKLLEEDVEE